MGFGPERPVLQPGDLLFSPTGGTPDPGDLRRWSAEIAPAVREKVGG
ncbi:hypothetical protein [Actinoplanes sp. NPDC051411]